MRDLNEISDFQTGLKPAHFLAPPTGLLGSVCLLFSHGLQSPLNEDYLDIAFNLLDSQITNGSVSP